MAVEEIRRQNPPTETLAEESPVAWGTWEELLLASAVNRYGTSSWDSISSELRKRNSAPILLTPQHCEQKYHELNRRFSQSNNADLDMDNGTAILWFDELRKLRVLELQRQLQNYDLYIESLQLKVKKLTEENEKKSDLGHKKDEIEYKNEEEAKNETPATAVSDGEVSDRDNQSVNGSNGNLDAGVDKSENEAIPAETGDEKPESVALSPEGKEAVKSESPESIAESKSDGKNSEVQSSVSQLRREKDRVRRGSRKVDEGEEDQSTDSIPVRSLPLVDFLQKLQKIGAPIFRRRLVKQEKVRYKNLIRQHIDFKLLQTRLKDGLYSDGNDKFFRDLLLLVNNTHIFFPKESPESVAAAELRQLILKEMTSKRKQKTEKQTSSKPNTTLPPKRASEPPDSLLLKPKLASPMIVCRKRSSIPSKAAAGSSSGAEKRKEQTDSENSDKLMEENQNAMKRTSDVLPLVSKKKGKNVGANITSEANSDHEQLAKVPPATNNSDAKNENKNKKKQPPTEAEEKKQSAAKFLNRMKRSSSSSNNGLEPKEQGNPIKRSVGRPPKRAAAAPPPMSAGSGNRNREPTESESLSSKQKKKRSKR